MGGALALYHFAPLVRAVSRIAEGELGYGKALGGPVVHLIVHGLCFGGLAGCYFSRSSW